MKVSPHLDSCSAPTSWHQQWSRCELGLHRRSHITRTVPDSPRMSSVCSGLWGWDARLRSCCGAVATSATAAAQSPCRVVVQELGQSPPSQSCHCVTPAAAATLSHSRLKHSATMEASFPEDRGDTQHLPAVVLSRSLWMGPYFHNPVTSLASPVPQSRLLFSRCCLHQLHEHREGQRRQAAGTSRQAGASCLLCPWRPASRQPTGFGCSLIRAFLTGSASPGAEISPLSSIS